MTPITTPQEFEFRRRTMRGFTLSELMAVIVTLGLFAVVFVPIIMNYCHPGG